LQVALTTLGAGKYLNRWYGVFVPHTKSATLSLLLFIDSFRKLVFYCGGYMSMTII